MNKNNLITFSLLALVAMVGGYFLTNSNTSNKMTNEISENNNVMVDANTPLSDKTMVKNEDSMMKDETAHSGYVAYSPDYLDKYQGKTKVLFFHASWCPTCNAADKDINENLTNMPDKLVILKTDYDTQADLKKKYGVTYQHTFVLVDDQGNELDKWNGGGFNEVIERL